MELQKVLEERRSIRAYEPGCQVEKAQIEDPDQKGMSARDESGKSDRGASVDRQYFCQSPLRI